MKKSIFTAVTCFFTLLSTLVFTFSFTVSRAQGTSGVLIDPNLRLFVQGETRASYAPVVVLMERQPTSQVPQVYNTPEVIDYLRWQVTQGWRRVSEHLQSRHGDNNQHIQPSHLFFLNQSFTAWVSVEGLRRLSFAPGVQKIYFNYEVSKDDPFPSPDYSGDLQQIPPNFQAIGLDRLIREQPTVDGRGVILGAIDTGVDGSHQDISGKAPFMFSSRTNTLVTPRDEFFHGTHVSGIMVGGDRTSKFIGVAPRSTLVMASAVNTEGYLLSMHFMLDTDGRSTSSYDIPRAVNNSWGARVVNEPDFFGGGGRSSNPCASNVQMPDLEVFYRALSALEAAGVLPVFSAGNCGPQMGTITPPKEHPSTLTVGSLGVQGNVAQDSSRGPANFRGQVTYKPELVAPGENILSTMPGGRYQRLSGTSMAAPHVTGTVGLMAQVNPRLTPADFKDILIRTATPRSRNGGPGEYGQWTPEYGYGVLNAYAAVRMAYEWANGGSSRNIMSGSSLPLLTRAFSLRSMAPAATQGVQRRTVEEALRFPQELEGDWLKASELF